MIVCIQTCHAQSGLPEPNIPMCNYSRNKAYRLSISDPQEIAIRTTRLHWWQNWTQPPLRDSHPASALSLVSRTAAGQQQNSSRTFFLFFGSHKIDIISRDLCILFFLISFVGYVDLLKLFGKSLQGTRLFDKTSRPSARRLQGTWFGKKTPDLLEEACVVFDFASKSRNLLEEVCKAP